MSKRYSGKSFKDSSVMKKAKLSLKEKRKIKKIRKRVSEILFASKNKSSINQQLFKAG